MRVLVQRKAARSQDSALIFPFSPISAGKSLVLSGREPGAMAPAESPPRSREAVAHEKETNSEVTAELAGLLCYRPGQAAATQALRWLCNGIRSRSWLPSSSRHDGLLAGCIGAGI